MGFLMMKFRRLLLSLRCNLERVILCACVTMATYSCVGLQETGSAETFMTEVPVPLSTRSDCLSISGLYNNFGVALGEDQDIAVTLDGSVFGVVPAEGTTDNVRLNVLSEPDGFKMDVVGFGLGSSYESSKNTFSAKCDGGWLEFRFSDKSYVDGTASKSEVLVRLTPSLDENNLVVRYIYDITSTSLLFFESNKTGGAWYMFERLDYVAD